MVLIERMCAGKEFQVEGADTEKVRGSWLKALLFLYQVLTSAPEFQEDSFTGCLNPVTSAGRTSVDIGASAKL